jgi:Trans-aconitate methyltransferase
VELNRQSADPADYAELLSRAGCEVDAWETTYVHILQGEDPVLEWYKGTGLRPVLAALDAERAGDFLAEYGTELRGRIHLGRSAPFSRSAACSPWPIGPADLLILFFLLL